MSLKYKIRESGDYRCLNKPDSQFLHESSLLRESVFKSCLLAIRLVSSSIFRHLPGLRSHRQADGPTASQAKIGAVSTCDRRRARKPVQPLRIRFQADSKFEGNFCPVDRRGRSPALVAAFNSDHFPAVIADDLLGVNFLASTMTTIFRAGCCRFCRASWSILCKSLTSLASLNDVLDQLPVLARRATAWEVAAVEVDG